MKVNLSISATKIQTEIGKAASISTIPRLKKHVLKRIYKNNQNKRLKFAHDHVDTPISFWKGVLWSNEPKFNIFGSALQ